MLLPVNLVFTHSCRTYACYIFKFGIFGHCCFAREREEQRQAKQAAADQSKPKREATADPAVPSQHAHTSLAVLATNVEDSKLPGFAKQPPPADPIGTGLLSPQQLSGTTQLGSRLLAVVPDATIIFCSCYLNHLSCLYKSNQ